jgi:DedD protein
MDHELKQRLIGAVVVTALAAIFIPMLFDDPVDTSGKEVKELTIPQVPADAAQDLPDDKAQVLNRPDIELEAREINEDGFTNPTGEPPETDILNGKQTRQADMADVAKGSNAENPEHETTDGSIPKPASQNSEPTLDTGEVQAVDPVEDNQGNAVITPRAEKSPQQNLEPPVNKTESKPVVSEKIKEKSVSSAVKSKTVDKAVKEPTKKTSSKLVRYSIQAGSFNKRENAQSLVDKLRKQGMPASLVAKGDYFRVKIGPALDKEKAKDMKAKLDKQNIKGLLTSE